MQNKCLPKQLEDYRLFKIACICASSGLTVGEVGGIAWISDATLEFALVICATIFDTNDRTGRDVVDIVVVPDVVTSLRTTVVDANSAALEDPLAYIKCHHRIK